MVTEKIISTRFTIEVQTGGACEGDIVVATPHYKKEIVASTLAELNDISTSDLEEGSTAIITSTGTPYILNANAQWVESSVPTGTINIVANGSYDVAQYGTADVQIAGGLDNANGEDF